MDRVAVIFTPIFAALRLERNKDMPNTKHTPTPWNVEGRGNAKARCFIEAGEFRIVECVTRDHDANAAFIVRACNAHDDLVAALREAHSALNGAPNTLGLHSQIEAALAKATAP